MEVDKWCKECMRSSTCIKTVEECKNTPPITPEQILESMEKYNNIYSKVNDE